MSTNPATEMIAQFVGRQIPGGCAHCDAYQTVETARGKYAAVITPDDPDDYLDGCFICTVHHDDWCPWWLLDRNRAERRAAHKQSKRRRR
jgi:hypothetical protein